MVLFHIYYKNLVKSQAQGTGAYRRISSKYIIPEPPATGLFQFKDADIKFHSDGYEWLVVFGARSWFQGTGTVDGIGEYKFIVTAIDADIDPNDDIEIDLFRIKIWSEDQYGIETIIYDNGFGSTDFSEEWATEINKGDIKINYGQ